MESHRNELRALKEELESMHERELDLEEHFERKAKASASELCDISFMHLF